jgi:hypothetical protein
MTESDFQYFQRRATEERSAAELAGHPSARRAHLELAERYSDMAEAAAGTLSSIELRLVPLRRGSARG